jgi:heme A synthase
LDNTAPTQKRFTRFAWGVLVYNLVVILWGALVRATGSGAGCGAHWPLCNGEALPGLTEAHRIIEFLHRASVFVGIVLVAAIWWQSKRLFEKGHPARRGAFWSGIFTFSESMIGAALVLFKLVAHDDSAYRAVATSAHLINTFFLVATLTLTAWWSAGYPGFTWRGQKAVAALIGIALLVTLIVGASGAVTALGDTLFPAASRGELGAHVSATAHFLKRLRVVHPYMAVSAAVYCVIAGWLIAAMRPSPQAKNFAYLISLLFVAQIGAGFLNLLLLAPLGMQLVHLLLADAVWICLVLLAASALAEGAPRVSLAFGKRASVEGVQ